MWGRAFANVLLRSAEGLLFQTIKISVIDVDQLLEPALGEGLWLVVVLLCHMLRSSDWLYVYSVVKMQFCLCLLAPPPKMKCLTKRLQAKSHL